MSSTAASAEPTVDIRLGVGESWVSRINSSVDAYTIYYSNVVAAAEVSASWWGTYVGARIGAGGAVAFEEASLPRGSSPERVSSRRIDVDVAFRAPQYGLSFAAGPSLINYGKPYFVGVAAEVRREWQVDRNTIGAAISVVRTEAPLAETSTTYFELAAGIVVGFK